MSKSTEKSLHSPSITERTNSVESDDDVTEEELSNDINSLTSTAR